MWVRVERRKRSEFFSFFPIWLFRSARGMRYYFSVSPARTFRYFVYLFLLKVHVFIVSQTRRANRTLCSQYATTIRDICARLKSFQSTIPWLLSQIISKYRRRNGKCNFRVTEARSYAVRALLVSYRHFLFRRRTHVCHVCAISTNRRVALTRSELERRDSNERLPFSLISNFETTSSHEFDVEIVVISINLYDQFRSRYLSRIAMN